MQTYRLVPALLLLFALAACSGIAQPPAPTTQKQIVSLEGLDEKVEVELPGDWNANPSKHPFDLQFLANDQAMNTGVFLYDRESLGPETTIESALDDQVKDMASKRENFKEIRPPKFKELDKARLVSTSYSGERDGALNHYRFTAIEFPDHPKVLLVVLQVCLPERWDDGLPVLEKITDSFAVL
ncbi:MAG: hypothetical protein AB7S38_23560 [Vulcanimicrobiota bacterium]